MNLEKARQNACKQITLKCRPVEPAKIQKFTQDMEEDCLKYLVESRFVAKKTAELSRIVCVA